MAAVTFHLRAMRCLFAIVCVVCCVTQVPAQVSDRERMARAYEQGGDQRGAARIYLELYQEHPTSRPYFDGVVRTMSALSQYEGLLPIAEQYLATTQQADIAILCGVVASRAGKPDDPYWDKAVKLGKSSEYVYAQIGAAQAQLFLTSKAISSYERARALSGDETTYAQPLARLYTAAGNHAAAVREILSTYYMDGNESAAQGRLAAIMATSEGSKEVGKGLEAMSQTNPDVLRLLWWFYTQENEWERAYQIVQQIDERESLGGQLILRFAETARKASAYEVALKAYSSLLGARRTIAITASYGYTQTLDQQLTSATTISAADAQRLLDRYQEIADTHADHPLAANALLRIAEISLQYRHDEQQALQTLLLLSNKWPGTPSAIQGQLVLADLYYARGQETMSDELLSQVEQSNTTWSDVARFTKTDHQLFKGNLTQAQAEYLEQTANTNSETANDALDRLSLLMLFPDDSVGVKQIVGAMRLEAQHKPLDAAIAYNHASHLSKNVDVQEKAGLESARLYFALDSSAAALSALQPILARIPASNVGDRALMLAADYYQRSGNNQEAINVLTTLLVQYPRSILTPVGRERIRKLRGDA